MKYLSVVIALLLSGCCSHKEFTVAEDTVYNENKVHVHVTCDKCHDQLDCFETHLYGTFIAPPMRPNEVSRGPCIGRERHYHNGGYARTDFGH